jgi:hypothetical protein
MQSMPLARSTLAVIFALVAWCFYIEPRWLESTRRDVEIPDLRQSIRLAHASDFHADVDTPPWLIESAVGGVLDSQPDIVCLTGDFVTSIGGFDPAWYRAQLKRLSSRAPVYAVLGNHDGGEWASPLGGYSSSENVARLLAESGIEVLHNRAVTLSIRGATIQIAGIGDLWSGEVDAKAAFAGLDGRLPTILLAHNPDSKVFVKDLNWSLMLSGHTHGGQIVAPFLGWNPAPVWDRRYVSGLRKWRGRQIHVSRGLGSARGVRFNCRPEVTLLLLKSPPDSIPPLSRGQTLPLDLLLPQTPGH